MKKLILPILVSLVISCATPRNKETDPLFRVMVDPVSVDNEGYTRIVKALVQSGKWTVVDRGYGFHAVKAEQNRQHVTEADRFADKEKWAQWSKLYGVRGIIIANMQCQDKYSLIPFPRMVYKYCQQFLTLVDANTAEVVAAVEEGADGPRSLTTAILNPSWDDTVVSLVESVPAHFDENPQSDRLRQYREESRQLAGERKSTSH